MVSCLNCGAYDDRYCGCWRDRIPGYAGFEPLGQSDRVPLFHSITIKKGHSSPPAPYPQELGNLLHGCEAMTYNPMLKLRGVRGGQRPPAKFYGQTERPFRVAVDPSKGGGWE